MSIPPVVLEGSTVRLEPVRLDRAEELAEAAEPEYFQHYVTLMPRDTTPAGIRDFIAEALEVPNMLAFAIIHRESGRAIGMTSYLDISLEHRRLEIGFTWINERYRGTRVNPECKLLLMTHAFETLDVVRVQLKTDGRNILSQRAIEKLGAVKEGTLRKFGIQPNGYVRDTVMYSVIADEWPGVKAGLLARLEATR